MPFMFCCSLGFRFHLFSSEYDQNVLKCLTIDCVYVSECLQCPFSQQGMKMGFFQLLGHHGLHFDHRMEQVLKELKFFALAIKYHGRGQTGRIFIDCGLFWGLTSTSANLFNGSWVCRAPQALEPTRSCPERHCGSIPVSQECEWTRPVRNSGICRWVSVAPVIIKGLLS